jgi:glycosyltransferase involved in cell wall biosynthesis
MKLLFVSNGFPPRGQWGTEFYTHQLVLGLREAGHEVAVMHPVRDGAQPRYRLERAEGDRGIPVYLLHNPGDPSKRFESSYRDPVVEERFREVLDQWQPDLVHFTYLLWGLSIGLPRVAREAGVARVATLTDYGLLCHRGQMFNADLERCGGPHPPAVCARCVRQPSIYDLPLVPRLAKHAAAGLLSRVGGAGRVVVEADFERREEAAREALSELQVLIAPTRVLAESFMRWGAAPERLAVECYSIDPEPYAVARPEPPRSPVRFGFFGQFTPHKGLHVLFEAVELLSHRLPESVEPWEVQLYGKPAGGRNQLYGRRVFERDPGRRVIVGESFSPPEAPRVLAPLHALVLPSLWDENAPLTCLQARAAGVPILGSDVAGIAEVIRHGEHGLLFPPGDAAALADCMREVILGRLGRHPNPAQPVAPAAHLERIQGLYRAATGSAG